MDLPRNSTELAERHSQLSNAIVDASTEATHEGRLLLERVSSIDPGADGVRRKVSIFHTASFLSHFHLGLVCGWMCFCCFLGSHFPLGFVCGGCVVVFWVPLPFGFCLWVDLFFLGGGPISIWVCLWMNVLLFFGVPFPFGFCFWVDVFLGVTFLLGFCFGWMCFWGEWRIVLKLLCTKLLNLFSFLLCVAAERIVSCYF